ncbi:hypothetical protein CCUS01_16411 [Colletotrichum cuscutae]|uniref:Uncharacterized protein n=1 Tax=Colletotrichum cuscutae TaxID=1209917 RepID=A0AAI9VBQ2_9PEZI|nr:hypothetical protein CCUS01_16411 [Colletotrichum cuscutae]
MVAAVIGKSMNPYASRDEDDNTPADTVSFNRTKAAYASLSYCFNLHSRKKAAMDYRYVTIPQKDVGEVLASFDKSIQDHVERLTILYPLSVHTLELPASDDGALGFTFLGVVESAAEHLRDKIAAWTSWLHSSAAARETKQKDMQPYALLDLQSRTKPDEEEAPIPSSNAMHNLLPSEDSEATLVFPLEPHNQRHPNLSNWCFPSMHNQSPPSPGQLDISPSYGPFNLNTMSHAAPVHGLQPSSEAIADVAAGSSDDRGANLGTEATFEPCIEYSPGDIGLFVESSNQASPISNVQSLADSAVEGKANSHSGHSLLAAIDTSRGHDSELRAKSDTESHAFDIKIQPGISVEFDTDAESSNDMLAALGRETSHKEDIETRHDGKHHRHLDSVDKLIDIAVEYIDARNLFCQNPAQFRQKLGQFRPRTFVDDTALLQLLRMISEDTKLRVVDPLHLRLGEPFPSSALQEISVDLDGLVVPINVNASDQMSDANRDHWVLAVANWSTRTFDAFGMQRDSFHYWCSRIESLASEISGEPVKFRKKSHELGPYVDDSCCAFLCSYALDRYVSANLRHNGPWPTGPELREIYLRRLLNHWGLPSGFLPYRAQQMDFDLVDSPQSTVVSSFSRSSGEVRCTEGHHHCLSSDLQRYSRNSGRDLGQLTEALNAAGSALKIEQRARLILSDRKSNSTAAYSRSTQGPIRGPI